MKRIFIKMLPVMAAVLLATSCSKDDGDNTVIDNVVAPQETTVQETPESVVKTITITGKVSKASLSKVTVEGYQLKFEGGESFTFNDVTNGVSGTITINDADGNYTATLHFTDETMLLAGSFTATLGTDPSDISTTAYGDLASAVKAAYYTIDFKVEKADDAYKMKSGESSDILVNIASAFVKAEASKSITVSGQSKNVDKGKYYVLSSTATMGSGKTAITPGKIYTVKAASTVPEGYVDLGIVVDGKEVYFEKKNSYPTSSWTAISDKNTLPTKAEWQALSEQCYWVWSSTDKGMYVFKAKEGFTNQNGTPASDFGSYNKDTDPCLFLPAALDGGVLGIFWSGTEYGTVDAYCLSFVSGIVYPEDIYRVVGEVSVLTVRRSN